MGDVENPPGDRIEDDGDDNKTCVIRTLMVTLGCLAVAILIIMIIGIFKGEEHL